jgi:eukaryotic-like serine/threonine-protein kinase
MTDLIANLRKGRKLGNGYFGEVFLCKDAVHGDVAAKVFRRDHPSVETDAAWQNRRADLLKEGQRLKDADHENVVRVHYLVERDDGNEIYLVMHLCDGGSLQSAFEVGPLPLDDVRRIWTQATHGLRAVHDRGMIHRDIKPSNLLVDQGIVKLGDFGLATDELVLGYASNRAYGDHAAYEIWNGEGTSVKSDIWALGMTAYRLIHGEQWCGRSRPPHEIIEDGNFAERLKWLPHVPKRWRTVIKTMSDDKDERYENANRMLQAIARLDPAPNWSCAVAPDLITWTRETADRRITVQWNQHSQRSYSWVAESEPLNGKGRRRTLSTSGGCIGYADSDKQLRQFFS